MAYRFCFRIQYHNQSIPLLHGSCNTLLQAFLILFIYNQFINDHLYIMVLITVEFHAVNNLTHFPIHTHIQITFLPHLFEKFFVMTFTCTHQRSQHKNLFALIIFMNQFKNLFFGVFHHFFSREIRICNTCTGKQQAKIVIHFGCCTYGRTRILIRCFLLYRNHRTQSCYLIYIRTFHSTQKITGICRECFYVSALSLSKDSIKCQ